MSIGLMLLGLIALSVINVPIAVALAVVGAAGTFFSYGVTALPEIPVVLFDGSTHYALLAIPLFLFAGAIIDNSSLARRFIDFTPALLGVFRGGLALADFGSSTFFA